MSTALWQRPWTPWSGGEKRKPNVTHVTLALALALARTHHLLNCSVQQVLLGSRGPSATPRSAAGLSQCSEPAAQVGRSPTPLLAAEESCRLLQQQEEQQQEQQQQEQ